MKVHVTVTDADGNVFQGEASLEKVSSVRTARPKLARTPSAQQSSGARHAWHSQSRASTRSRIKGKRHGGEGAIFSKWVAAGFFRQPRTSREILERFHREGRMLKQTSLPGYLLGATRSGLLERDKKQIGGKRVWVYSAPKEVKR